MESVTQLGPKQSLTAEGFLICKDVPLARTGVQTYHVDELQNVDTRGLDRGGFVAVYRDAAEVFAPASIQSYLGKPLVDEHPAEMVDPNNITAHQIGTVLNVRPGSGPDCDVLLGDLLVTGRRGIDLVRGGKRQLSVGYDAEYHRGPDGQLRQFGIRCNHVALVDEGRCGPRCAIGDAAQRKERKMSVINMSDAEFDTAVAKLAKRFNRDDVPSGNGVVGEGTSGAIGSATSVRSVGPRIVARLPGPASSYSIGVDGATGDTVVWQHASVSSVGVGMAGRVYNPGGSPQDRPTLTGDATEARYRLLAVTAPRMKAISAAHRDFWNARG